MYGNLLLVLFLVLGAIAFDQIRRRLARPRPEPPPPEPLPDPIPPPAPEPPPVDPDVEEAQEAFRLHNEYRASKGKPALAWSIELANAAHNHARHMAKVRRMAHMLIGDGDPWSRMRAAGYRYSSAAENVAGDYQSPAAVCRAWKEDTPHDRNMLGDYAHVGVAVARDEHGARYWCVDFGSPA